MSDWRKRAREALDKVKGQESEHAWFLFGDNDKLESCAKCGYVKRKDGKNNPCPGKVKVTLR